MSSDLPIILAVETTVRELDARLVLAALYARKGHRIFVVGGQSGQRVVHEMAGALFVGKHVIHPRAYNPAVYLEAKKNGFVVVHLAEEGGVFMGNESDWTWDLDDQLHPHFLAPEDYVCTWGDFQRDYYRTKDAANPGNIRTTGHPRFDVYKSSLRRFYEDEANALRAKYGNFVILCSNFGLANDPEGHFNTFSQQLGYIPEDDEMRLRSPISSSSSTS
jgi:surface carbohydrate biosynthesis protein